MKVATILLVCAFVHGQNIELNRNGCPTDYSIEKLYAHGECNKYYQCTHGNLVERMCFMELQFNVDKQKCDWPHDVDCGDRIIPNENGNGNGSGNGDNNGNDKGNGDNNGNGNGGGSGHGNGDNNGSCNCECSCPGPNENSNENGNENDNGGDGGDSGSGGGDCDNGNGNGDNGNGNGDNGNGENDGSCNCNPGEAPLICGRPGSANVLVAHEDCNKFYKCAHGLPVPQDCPVLLLFNPYIGVCDWPQNVDCGDRIIPDSNENGNGNGDGGNGDGNGDNGNGNGDNGNGENDGSCNCNPDEAPSICGRPGSDNELVAHEDCNKFYKCAHGIPVPQDCPGILLFNPHIKVCDWPQNVECGDRIIPDPNENGNGNGDGGNGGGNGDNGSGNGNGENGNGENDGSCNCNPGEAPSICGRPGSDNVLVAHEDCNKFYKCAHGIPVPQDCPGILLFNPHIRVCDWPQNVECGDRIIPDPNENDNGNGDGGNGDGNGDNGNGNGENDGSCNCNPGEAPSICGRPGSDNVLVAHEDCNKFYKCAHGIPVPQDCPGILLFNPHIKVCDWPQNVECGDRIIPDPNENGNGNGDGGNGGGNGDNGNGNGNGENGNGENDGSCNCNPSEAPSICGRPGSDNVLVAHEDCNKFYKCAHGIPVPQDCPGILLFNPHIKVCDWPQNVECGDRIIPDPNENGNGNGDGSNGDGNGDNGDGNGENGNGENDGSCNCNPGEAPSICGRPGSDNVLVAHEDCNKFYKCAHRIPVPQDCPGILLFNPHIKVCDWPQNVECGDRIIPDPNENGNGNGDGGNGGGNGDNGNGNGENGNGENDGSCNCNPGDAPSICGRPGSDNVLVAHEDCNKFYKCAHGIPVPQDCPGILLFNPHIRVCDWPQNVECGDRIIPDPNENDNGNGDGGNGDGNGDNGNGNGENDGSCNCNPGEAPSICGRPGSDNVLVAHEDCNKFYKCAHGIPVPQDCPGILLFNPHIKVCDWPQNVECGDRIIPDPNENDNGNGDGGNGGGNGDNGSGNGNGENGNGENDGSCNCNPGEAPSICGRPGSDNVLVAHEDCNKFYKCAHGIPVPQDCPGILLFNPHIKVCDWPQNVECGDRIIPDPNENGNGNGGGGNGDGNGDNGNGNGNGENGNGENDGSCNCNPGEAPSICGRPGSDNVLVAHEDCNKFYKCAHGIPVPQDCPGILLFNPHIKVCDWPQNVECGDRIISDPNENGNDNGDGGKGDGNGDNGNGNGSSDKDSSCEDSNSKENSDEKEGCYCNPQEAVPICQQAGSDGIHIAHEHCTKYYRCISGIAVPRPCPNGLHYNPYLEVCDWPRDVDCADRIIPDPDDIDSEEDNDSDENKDIIICNCNPEEAPLICARNNSNSVLVASKNCNQYYICDNGKPVIRDCPGNLLYNPYKELCDWPQDVDCGDRVIPDPKEIDNGNEGGNENSSESDINRPCNCDPDQAEAICAADNSESTLIAHQICNKYYICNFGLPVVQKCQGNLLYNPYKEICDWSANVDCSNRLRPGANDTDEGSCNCNPNEASAICANKNSNGVVIAHENCHQYYKCLNRRPMVLTCFNSYLFDPFKQKCDKPEDVKCGHRNRINNGN